MKAQLSHDNGDTWENFPLVTDHNVSAKTKVSFKVSEYRLECLITHKGSYEKILLPLEMVKDVKFLGDYIGFRASKLEERHETSRDA